LITSDRYEDLFLTDLQLRRPQRIFVVGLNFADGRLFDEESCLDFEDGMGSGAIFVVVNTAGEEANGSGGDVVVARTAAITVASNVATTVACALDFVASTIGNGTEHGWLSLLKFSFR
jgi:hypothetical protein